MSAGFDLLIDNLGELFLAAIPAFSVVLEIHRQFVAFLDILVHKKCLGHVRISVKSVHNGVVHIVKGCLKVLNILVAHGSVHRCEFELHRRGMNHWIGKRGTDQRIRVAQVLQIRSDQVQCGAFHCHSGSVSGIGQLDP